MLLGIILVDDDGFCVFEHLLDEFESYAISRKELYDAMDNLDSNGSVKYKTIKAGSYALDEKISLVLISPEDTMLSEEIKNNIIRIASKVSYGDKLAIRHILQSTSESDFLFQ